MRQRQACLDTAETIIQKLKPQFEHFLQVALLDGIRKKMVVNWFWLLIQMNLFETPKLVSVSKFLDQTIIYLVYQILML